MYPPEVRRRAVALVAAGMSRNQAAKTCRVSRAALREWCERGVEPRGRSAKAACPRCSPEQELAELPYSHLLGWYLGDGCLSAARKGVYVLRIVSDNRYPALLDEIQELMGRCHPGSRTFRTSHPGCTEITNAWTHWRCLFPQFGPGRKHTRPILLAPWQREIVERHPREFVRGLLHSDGCRVTNRVRRPNLSDGYCCYAYPRYFFTNVSDDIRGLFCWALDLLDIPWRQSNTRIISVARREAVAALDEFVGPKS